VASVRGRAMGAGVKGLRALACPTLLGGRNRYASRSSYSARSTSAGLKRS
jgi:hypothetical protein